MPNLNFAQQNTRIKYYNIFLYFCPALDTVRITRFKVIKKSITLCIVARLELPSILVVYPQLHVAVVKF